MSTSKFLTETQISKMRSGQSYWSVWGLPDRSGKMTYTITFYQLQGKKVGKKFCKKNLKSAFDDENFYSKKFHGYKLKHKPFEASFEIISTNFRVTSQLPCFWTGYNFCSKKAAERFIEELQQGFHPSVVREIKNYHLELDALDAVMDAIFGLDTYDDTYNDHYDLR